ncbi:MAG: hypothetical protein HQK79_06695 [Desulfobacterales bacterium]|nr:hypothetical protein [Desulfobacterales bacterium]
MKVLLIIVARKGSKGLPSKCMLKIADIPIVEHVISWTKSLKKDNIDITTAVSTDIVELKEICQKHNVIHINRPQKLAEDSVRIEEVIYHVCETLGGKWDYLCLLYGNIPIRYSELIHGPLDFLENNSTFDAVLSFQAVEKFHPAWMVEFSEDKLPKWIEKGYRRQELVPYMIHDGHTCITRYDYFIPFWREKDIKKTGQMYESFGKTIKPWINNKLVIDIDTERDYYLAKAILEAKTDDK